MRGLVVAIGLLLASCVAPSTPSDEATFQRWLASTPDRVAAFARFEGLLEREGVADVLPNRELWLSDRLAPECVVEPFTMPPEELWPNIIPALRFIREYVEPAVGDVGVASGYRDPAFNACVEGASRSAHLQYHALDLVPLDRAMTRERLITILCPIHAREGRPRHIGMGIYNARRFHIDARSYRGWGADFHGGTFPCLRAPR